MEVRTPRGRYASELDVVVLVVCSLSRCQWLVFVFPRSYARLRPTFWVLSSALAEMRHESIETIGSSEIEEGGRSERRGDC